VSIFWDPQAFDHMVEVKRFYGEGFGLHDLFHALQQAVLKEKAPATKKGGFLSRKALPLPPAFARSSSGNTSEESFIEGVQPIFRMAQEIFLESRLEAAKMLCDLAAKKQPYLQLPACVDGCVNALCVLLAEDQWEDVKQIAIVALSSFLELPAYKDSFAKREELSLLADLVANCPNKDQAYLYAEVRRKAALSLKLVSQSHAGDVLGVLQSQGYKSVDQWTSHVYSITDDRCRDLANELSTCYQTVF
jgi:hypothetical protein